MATTYPLPSFKFSVNWSGSSNAFSEVSGLNMEVQVIEYRDGTSPVSSVSKMPGMHKFGNITLKRGVVKTDNEFYAWFITAIGNTVDRRNITISLLDELGAPAVTWSIKNAFAVKIDNSGLKAIDNAVNVETLEIAHEGIEIAHN